MESSYKRLSLGERIEIEKLLSQGKKALKIERDLKALPFDVNRLVAAVDEPTYAKLSDLDFQDRTIEVKVF
jgi:hypothetical protein